MRRDFSALGGEDFEAIAFSTERAAEEVEEAALDEEGAIAANGRDVDEASSKGGARGAVAGAEATAVVMVVGGWPKRVETHCRIDRLRLNQEFGTTEKHATKGR